MAGHWLAELDGSRVTVEVPGLVGEPRRRLRLSRRRARDHQPDRARGPRLEPRRDRADGRGRGSQRADRGPRQPVRARPRGRPAGRPRRAPRRRRLADLDAQRHPARARPRLVGGGDGRRRPRRQRARRRGAVDARAAASSPARSRAIPTTPRPRCSAGSSCRPRDGPAGRGDPVRCAPRPAGRAVHPGAAPADRRDARRAAGRRPARRTRSPTSARSRSGSPAWPPAATTCSPS